MKNLSKLVFFYWLPVLFVATIIFVASSQSSEQQNIKPYIERVTDVEQVKSVISNMSVQYAKEKLSAVDTGMSGLITFVLERWKFLLVLLIIALLGIVVWLSVYVWKMYKQKGIDYVYKRVLYGVLVLFASFVFMIFAVYAAFRIETILRFVQSKVEVSSMIAFLKNVEFTYATSTINIERMGIERFIEFLIRKAAHFILFFCLGFLFYRAMWASNRTKTLNFISSLCFVVIYAVSDELHQAFTPSRSPLVQDVVLDSVGGLTGISVAFFLYFIIDSGRHRDAPKRLGLC